MKKNIRTCFIVVAISVSQLLHAQTYYLQSSPNVPWPLDPYGGEEPIATLDADNHIYLVEDSADDFAALSEVNRMSRMNRMDDLSPGGGDGGDFYSDSFDYVVPTNGLWLEITNIANGSVYLNLHHATNLVYEIYSKTDLALTNWSIEQEVMPGIQTNSLPFTVPQLYRTNLFIWARDWTGITSHGNATPDWWFWEYFGTVALSDTNLDSLGDTLSYDYRNGYNPNIIHFNLDLPIDPVTSTTVNGTIHLNEGTPTSMAVLVNDSNQADAVWQPYSTNFAASLNFGNGSYSVSVGLRGSPVAPATWQSGRVTLFSMPLTLTITNPANSSTVSTPMIQVQGFANEAISSLTYDVSNATGIFTNQTGSITGHFYDTNLLAYTTNYFQCYDVPLAVGLNVITVHGTNAAGSIATTSAGVTLDFSSDHTAPVLSVLWPTNGTSIAGNNFTVQARMDDATATATATINSNIVAGLAERSGVVWFKNLPLNSGTNTVTIAATDAAGNMSTTNLNIIKSVVGLTINPLSSGQMNQSSVTVTGTIGDSSDQVTVNGVTATVSGNNWTANNVPVNPNDTASLNAQVTDSGNNPLAVQSLYQGQPSQVLVTSYEENATYGDAFIECKTFHIALLTRAEEWTLDVGGYITQHSAVDGSFYECDAQVDLATNWNTAATNGTSCHGNYSETLNPAWQYCSVDQSESDYYYSDCGGFDTDYYTLARTADTKIEIAGGGQHQVGTQQLVLLKASAAEYSALDVDVDLTGIGQAWFPETNFNRGGNTLLPASAMRIMGQTLIPTTTNANVGETIVALPAGGTQDITPTISPASLNQNHYSFTAQAYDVKFQIIDANTGADLTDQTNTVIVGQQMNLKCQLTDTNFPLTNFQWTVPGYAISNYVVAADGSSAYVATNFPLNNTNVVFYWVDGANNRTVQVSATVNGTPIIAKATFNIYRPSLTFTDGPAAFVTNAVIDGTLCLSLGDGSFGDMEYRVNLLSAYDGSADYTQLVDGSGASGTHSSTTSGQFWLDNFRFYRAKSNDPSQAFYLASANTPRFMEFFDGPNLTLTDSMFNHTASVFDQFKDYVMFRPNMGNANNNIFVPLGKLTWSWSASTTYSGGSWSAPTYSITRPSSPDGGYEFPQWPNVFNNN